MKRIILNGIACCILLLVDSGSAGAQLASELIKSASPAQYEIIKRVISKHHTSTSLFVVRDLGKYFLEDCTRTGVDFFDDARARE
jgi:hypothetical protein